MLRDVRGLLFNSQVILGIIILSALYVFVVNAFPITADYFFFYRSIPQQIMAGEVQLYDPDVTFGLLPWVVPPLAFLSLLPLMHGQAVLTILNGIGLFVAARTVITPKDRRYWLWALLPIFTLHSFDLFIRTNLDGIVALGIGLSWLGYRKQRPLLMGLGMWLLTVKPIHVVLFGLLMLWAIRQWSWRNILLVLAPVGLSFLISTWVLGVGWISDYLSYMLLDINDEQVIMPIYLQTSLWRLFEDVGLPVGLASPIMLVTYLLGVVFIFTRRTVTREQLGIVLGITTVFSAYSMGYHYVVLIPVFVVLLQYRLAYAWIWLLTLTPLLRLYWGFNYVWVDSFYAMVLFASSCYVYFSSQGHTHQATSPEIHRET